MENAKEMLTDDADMDTRDMSENEPDADSNIEKDDDLEKKQAFIRQLVDAGQREDVARRAVEYIELDNMTDGILWCLEHEQDEIEGDHREAQQDMAMSAEPNRKPFSGWSHSESSLHELIRDNVSALGQHCEVGVKPLIDDMNTLWKEFLTSIISANVKDYLSLEHLGIILQTLAAKGKCDIQRQLPPGLKDDCPNLVVCPAADVLPTTLSLYMTDTEQPLPQSEEILVCTSSTSKDEVEIFLRRAFFEKSQKIYCLVNADLLDYDVCDISQKVLEEFQKDLKIIGAKYRLIIICSAENETRSSMVSFLDKFRRQPPIVSVDKVLAYTTMKLQAKSEDGCVSAGSVDVHGSTVRVIKSSRSGVGKTLYKLRRDRALKALNKANINTESVTIPLQEKSVDLHYVMAKLLKHTLKPSELAARIFHFDISHEVQNDVDYLLFNLLILGCLVDKTGYVWRRSHSDLYLIETMPICVMTNVEGGSESRPLHSIFTILPTMTCRSPRECLAIYNRQAVQEYEAFDQFFDEDEFRSDKFQRPFQYLLRLKETRRLDDVQPNNPEGTTKQCLEVFFRYCGIDDPSWSELHNFVWFLNTQLIDYVNNNFVSAAAAEDLPGFSKFVLTFLIQMSKDFSTRSLRISEETPGLHAVSFERMETEEEDLNEDEDIVKLYQMRRTWESSPHPYLFFNCDREAFTFLGFNINPLTFDLVDQQTEKVLVPKIMEKNLYEALIRNKVTLNEDFRQLDRLKQIAKLCDVMGIKDVHDPDDTYELTPDNVKKMMAIYMRFRCDIPVVIMGETGCGKTRLIKFMCTLQIPKKAKVPNMILMKVHGGTTNQDIIKRVRKAESIAKQNMRKFGDKIYTVLFFDEANTTEAIGLIKEIMCDKSIEGIKLKLSKNLKIVAACNPYRKHSEELIQKLEQAGLGYHVDAKDTTDKLGKVPMRRLVYRVQPLPQSLLPLVWDFGQLNTNIEDLYIRQMVKRFVHLGELPLIFGMDIVISGILTVSQDFMRRQKDECSFVSLRDVDRVLTVMCWFYKQSKTDRILYNLIDKKMFTKEADGANGTIERIDDLTRSLILAIGVCYHACLKRRSQYREEIAKHFKTPCDLRGGAQRIFDEIDCCQDVFLDNVDLEENISRNLALKENVFMMVICIELRIPLFLIGKPGSSKSLAKTIVLDAMRGNGSKKKLFRQMKQVKMTSYQCSPLSTPEGVVAIFKEGAGFQKDNMETFVSVVVLDEIGLAEDSPRMPLKTLHPLLEDGCEGEEEPQDYMKVAFIGISNWALDPAKMNRGIVVQRDVPDLEELVITARGICQTDKDLARLIEPMLQPMAEAYLELFAIASKRMREFFGLRDFYSLVKMLCGFMKKTKQIPSWYQLVHAIKRNFGGLDQVDPVDFFKKHLTKVIYFEDYPRLSDPDCSAQGLIRECLSDTNNSDSESRYLLLLTENFGALSIIQQLIFEQSDQIKPIVIFGSSFRRDQEYTQVCRNINKIKICMETGNTVVLLNLENLYESLYDALNQYYSKFGDVRYVDLGLGTHRVKCPVHENFRLIVVAEKETVYKKFPIPLINRLEKHFLTTNTMLSARQRELVEKLDRWAQDFAGQRKSPTWLTHRSDEETVTKVGDVFTGYHEDTCSAIVIHVWEQHAAHQNDVDDSTFKVIFHDAKLLLLWCATPDALMRLKDCKLPFEEQNALLNHYCSEQAHDNLLQYLQFKLVKTNTKQLFAQVTTHSKLMSSVHKKALSEASGIKAENILLLETLSSFDTEQQFSNKIQNHMQSAGDSSKLIIIQCDSGNENGNLIACARYSVMGEYEKLKEVLQVCVHIVIVVQLPNVAGGCFSGFQCGKWQSVHIDDLCPDDYELPPLPELQHKSAGMLVESAVTETVEMETEETDQQNRGTFENAEMEWEDNVKQKQFDIQEERFPIGPESDATQYDTVHLDDVVFDLKNSEIESRSGQSKHTTRSSLDVKKLVLSCVHPALSKVKDKKENKHRETSRVDLVLKLFHQDTAEGRNSFLYGVCCLLAKILQSKESKSGTAHWIGNEAARLKNINKAGTFRRSCIKVLETKLSPILAGIIAFLDTNENLKLLQETQQQWKKEFWLTVLNTPNAVTLQYTDFQSPQKGSELEEVLVLTTGFEGRDFRLRMPFSWLLIDKINNILNLQLPVEDKYEWKTGLRSESCFRVLRESPLCKIADQLNDCAVVTEAQSDYMFDLVHTMYPAESDIEYDLVCQAVRSVSDLLQNEKGNSSVLSMAINAHLAFELLAPRMNYFHLITTLWPDCCSAVEKVRLENPNHFLVTENDLTSCATFLLLETLTPEKNELDIQYSRSKWLKKSVQYRSVVEKVIRFYEDLQNCRTDIPLPHQTIRRIKAQWSRIMVIKLFIEHVCVLEKDTRITIQYCSPLWKLLGEETDMKNKESLTAVEKFMKLCQMNAMREYMGTILKCSDCETMLEGIPITLPCKDILCDRCYSDLKATRRNTCTKCRQTFPDEWVPGKSIQPSMAEEKLKDYQVRCNAFFMDMVSQLCFADSKAPSKDVIEKLLTYVFCETRAKVQKTKEFSVLSIGLDPNPVFRSFLLQLLMQTSEESVLNNLETFLNGMKSTISSSEDVAEEKLQYMEICTLVIQCIEDNLLMKLNKEDTDNRLNVARNALQIAKQTIETDGVSVEKLYGLARARVGLAEVASHIAQLMKKKSKTLPKHDLLEMAKKLCEDSRSEWPRKFLVKYICRFYGVDVYQAISRSEDRYLHWIIMEEVVEVPDRYITSGEIYRQIRECIAKVLLGEAVTTIEEKIQDIEKTTTKAEPMFHLAVHRTITCSFVLPQERRRTHPKIIDSIQKLVQGCGLLKNKKFVQALINNALQPKQLIVAERQDLRHQGIQCLVAHFWIAMSSIKTDTNLLRPLLTLMKKPHLCENMFVPTMPQDDLEDVKEALIAARTTIQNADQQPTFYRCPNGHPYVIGNCGKPDQISKCQCGADIGGQAHKLVTSNTADTAKDTTMTGHILGRAELRGTGPKPERSLTPAQCAVLRLFVHLAMFVGAGVNSRGVQRIIKPDIEENEVDEYLWSHIELDLEDIHRAFARSLDDVLIFAHSIVAGLLNKCDEDKVLEDGVNVLSTKRERHDWECSFISRYVHEYIKDLEKLLETYNAELANDERLGSSSLLCALYETATENVGNETDDIQDTPRVWRYRTPISLEHLRQTLEANADAKDSAKQEYKVLRLFIREEHHLRALRYIPSILRLHRALFRKYQLKLDKAEALLIKVERIKKDKVAGFDTENLLQDFSDAWELIREDLKFYVCPTENGGMTVPKEFCSQRITDDTPVAMLLPTSKGAGLCSYALLDFLMRKQNGFLDQYIKETGSVLSSMTVVSPKDVTSAHLINFDFQHDFLPLVMANCQYSFEIGQGTKIEYDFVAIERQLMDRFLFSKSRIDVKYILQIDMMTYRTEFTNALVFKQLAEKIPQENLNMAIKKHICQELKMLPDICESLYNLDIAISFLKSASIDPNKNLHNFMKKTLLMEESLRSQTAQQICQLKHARSLWLMMALHKSKVMSDQQHKREYVFESVSSEFDENLEEGDLSVLTAYTRNLSVEKLTRLIEVLHEFILLKLSEKQNTYDEDYTDQKHNQIKAWLLAYLENDDILSRDAAIFAEFPDELQYRHILHVWTEAYLMFKEKQMGHSGKF